MNKLDDYEDIINLPHHTSSKHPRMTIESRAAQFAPFSALTGYKEAVRETERLTEERIILDEDVKIILNNKLQLINDNLKDQLELKFTYFIKDKNKDGGKYIEKIGIVKTIDQINNLIILTDKTKINIKEIIDIDGEIFKNINDN